MCKCSLCGEILNAPIFYKGSVFGSECIKRIYPDYKHSKKIKYVIADSFNIEKYNNGNIGIEAKYNGKNYIDCNINGKGSFGVIIHDNIAYINLLKYKK